MPLWRGIEVQSFDTPLYKTKFSMHFGKNLSPHTEKFLA